MDIPGFRWLPRSWSLDDMCILTPRWGCNGGGRNNSAQAFPLEGGSGGGEMICRYCLHYYDDCVTKVWNSTGK